MDFFLEYGPYFAVFLAGVLSSAVAISYFFYFLKSKTGKKSSVKGNSGSRQVINSEEYAMALQLRELRQELAETKVQLGEKIKEIRELNDELLTVKEQGRRVELEVESNRISRYFSVPSKNGTFPEEKGSKKENENTWFRIEYDKGKPFGSLFYLAGKSDRRALNQMDLFLKPVCEFENTAIPDAQKIKVLHPGKVILKDGSWVIEKKIKLRLS